MCNIGCTGPKAMDKLTGDTVRQTRERHTKLASVSRKMAIHFASLAAAPCGSDRAVYGREVRAQNQSDSHLKAGLKKVSGGGNRKVIKQTGFVLCMYSDGAAQSRTVFFREIGHRINHARR